MTGCWEGKEPVIARDESFYGEWGMNGRAGRYQLEEGKGGRCYWGD